VTAVDQNEAGRRFAVGDSLPPRTFALTRADLVRYCGASGDFNPIHWSDRQARAASLPGVIAHGMLTMGLAVRIVTDWLGAPSAVLDYETRFARPVVVPDDDRGVGITVTAVLSEHLPRRRARFDLTARVGGEEVFGRCAVIAQLPDRAASASNVDSEPSARVGDRT